MTADQAATEAALADLLALGMPARAAKALADVMSLGARAVIDLVGAEMRDRARNPKPWATFHRVMAQRLPRWRVLARAHHRRMARRYDAMVAAGTAVPCG